MGDLKVKESFVKSAQSSKGQTKVFPKCFHHVENILIIFLYWLDYLSYKVELSRTHGNFIPNDECQILYI